MKPAARIFINIFVGALVCFFFSAASFTLVSRIDGTRMGEALGYGAVVGLVGLFFGGMIGFIVGVLRQGRAGGALTGLLMIVFLILIYVLTFSRPGQALDFAGESLIIPVILAVPFILTGFLVGIVNKRNLLYSK